MNDLNCLEIPSRFWLEYEAYKRTLRDLPPEEYEKRIKKFMEENEK